MKRAFMWTGDFFNSPTPPAKAGGRPNVGDFLPVRGPLFEPSGAGKVQFAYV